MPIREYACGNPTCRLNGYRRERYEKTTPPPAPVCECGEMMQQLASPFGVVFAGAITSRYNDKTKEYANREGEWILEKKAPNGPKWTFCETWEQRKRVLKQEGLIEAGPGEIDSEGR